MKPAELLTVLRECHRDKLTARQRHVAVAKQVGDYEFNNTYQYIINREDVQLQWLEAAIADLAGTPDVVAEPTLPARGRKDSILPLVAEDARQAADFVAKWKPRAAKMTQARHRTMMGVILGETLEQKRFFDQMTAGNDDLLGRRHRSVGTGDGVMAVRWIE